MEKKRQLLWRWPDTAGTEEQELVQVGTAGSNVFWDAPFTAFFLYYSTSTSSSYNYD